jgi:hypothetical protein
MSGQEVASACPYHLSNGIGLTGEILAVEHSRSRPIKRLLHRDLKMSLVSGKWISDLWVGCLRGFFIHGLERSALLLFLLF